LARFRGGRLGRPSEGTSAPFFFLLHTEGTSHQRRSLPLMLPTCAQTPCLGFLVLKSLVIHGQEESLHSVHLEEMHRFHCEGTRCLCHERSGIDERTESSWTEDEVGGWAERWERKQRNATEIKGTACWMTQRRALMRAARTATKAIFTLAAAQNT